MRRGDVKAVTEEGRSRRPEPGGVGAHMDAIGDVLGKEEETFSGIEAMLEGSAEIGREEELDVDVSIAVEPLRL